MSAAVVGPACDGVGEVCSVGGAIAVSVGVTVALGMPSIVMPGACVGKVGGAIAMGVGVTVALVVLGVVTEQATPAI